MRYLIHLGVCLGFVLCWKGCVSASGWTCVGCDTFHRSATQNLEAFHLRQGNISIKLESANPSRALVAEEISTQEYLRVKGECDAKAMHDIGLRLLVKHDAMSVCREKTVLCDFLSTNSENLVECIVHKFQRDYIILWQTYVLYIKMVRSISDYLFISYAEKAFDLARVHDDEAREGFIVSLFLDKLNEIVPVPHIRLKIIESELNQRLESIFFKRLTYMLGASGCAAASYHRSVPPFCAQTPSEGLMPRRGLPTYLEAVQTIKEQTPPRGVVGGLPTYQQTVTSPQLTSSSAALLPPPPPYVGYTGVAMDNENV